MDGIPTAQDNPKGLHQRYAVTRADGSPTDASAVYFVLRLDGRGDDKHHIAACQAAALEYVDRISGNDEAGHLWPVADDLLELISEIRKDQH